MEQRNKEKNDQKIQQQMKKVIKKSHDLLQQETETEARYLKQNYHELGPKAAKLLARWLRKQQAEVMVHKLHNPKTNQLKCELKRIENIFRDYYKDLYNHLLQL